VVGDIPAVLREIADAQAGVVSRQQALAVGLSGRMIVQRVGYRRWQQLYRGVYALYTGEPSREAMLWAAVLRMGPGAVLSHQSAAELGGLTDEPAALVHVTVPANRRVARVRGIVVHISGRVGEAQHPCLLPPRTRIEETVLDLTQAAATFDDACGWVTRACGRRLTTEERLRAAMGARRKLRWRAELGEVLTATGGGVHTLLEYRYYRDVERSHALPPAARQARVVRGTRSEYRDVLYEEYQLAVETDGRVAHPPEARWGDIRRDNAAAADGITTLRYSWADVTRRPCRVAAEVAEALRQRGWPELPRPCSPVCPVNPGPT
jgi:hypothetical protein